MLLFRSPIIIFSIFFLLLQPFPSHASDDDPEEETISQSASEGRGGSPGRWIVSFYKDHISPIDGSRCPSSPSCSTYSLQAIKKHGFFIGWMMTVDRLIHEGREEAKVSPMVFSEGKWKIYDPVENNDFWWYEKKKKILE